MRAKELIKLLKRNGWQEISQKRFSFEDAKRKPGRNYSST